MHYMYLCGWYVYFDNNKYMIKSIKKMLTNKFNMKDLDIADIILWIQIIRTSNELLLSQSYVEKILDEFSKCDNNIVKTLMDMSMYMYKK